MRMYVFLTALILFVASVQVQVRSALKGEARVSSLLPRRAWHHPSGVSIGLFVGHTILKHTKTLCFRLLYRLPTPFYNRRAALITILLSQRSATTAPGSIPPFLTTRGCR
jgi:hypothetical protein